MVESEFIEAVNHDRQTSLISFGAPMFADRLCIIGGLRIDESMESERWGRRND